jgi:hypothetical protein
VEKGSIRQVDEHLDNASLNGAGANAGADELDLQLGAPDFLLGVLTLPLLLFALMFATSGTTELFTNPVPRRKLMAVLLVIEAIGIGAIVWAITK